MSYPTLDDVRQMPLAQKLGYAASGAFDGANGTPLGNAMLIFEASTQLRLFQKIASEARRLQEGDMR